MTLHNIEGYAITTHQHWVATCGDQEATGATEQEAIERLMGMDRKVRLRLILAGKEVGDAEWVTRRQLEYWWDDIEAHAKAHKATVILDHPESSIIHIFAY